ncbi:hypothetical protein QNN00_10210 [Bacillus velezensis]|nr:hypothetical protein [Bacillus velezensis]
MKAIWHGGTIYTMLDKNHVTEAVYTEEGVVRQTGASGSSKEHTVRLIRRKSIYMEL